MDCVNLDAIEVERALEQYLNFMTIIAGAQFELNKIKHSLLESKVGVYGKYKFSIQNENIIIELVQ